MKTNEIILNADYHTHTVYSHGKGTILENAQRAKELGFAKIAITDHGFGHYIFAMKNKKFSKFLSEVDLINSQQNEIKVLKGIEANLIGINGDIDMDMSKILKLDVLLCGFHKPVFGSRFSDNFKLIANAYIKHFIKPTKKMVARSTLAYVNAVKRYPIDILTHLNYHIKVDCKQVARVCAEHGTFIELSSRHLDCSEQDILDMLDSDVKFVLNSDAHKAQNVGVCDLAKELVCKYNIPLDRIVNYGHNNFEFRLQKYKESL